MNLIQEALHQNLIVTQSPLIIDAHIYKGHVLFIILYILMIQNVHTFAIYVTDGQELRNFGGSERRKVNIIGGDPLKMHMLDMCKPKKLVRNRGQARFTNGECN